MFYLLEAGARLHYPEIQITSHEILKAGKENWERFYESCLPSVMWFELVTNKVKDMINNRKFSEGMSR